MCVCVKAHLKYSHFIIIIIIIIVVVVVVVVVVVEAVHSFKTQRTKTNAPGVLVSADVSEYFCSTKL